MDVNSKLMLQAERFYDWCVASSANFNKGVATKRILRTTGLDNNCCSIQRP